MDNFWNPKLFILLSCGEGKAGKYQRRPATSAASFAVNPRSLSFLNMDALLLGRQKSRIVNG